MSHLSSAAYASVGYWSVDTVECQDANADGRCALPDLDECLQLDGKPGAGQDSTTGTERNN